MGLSGIWEVLGEGELKSLAELSAEYFQKNGRPLRIAVDEVNWRFKNINQHGIKAIQEKVAAANPIEKANFHRIVALSQLNIQLLFVFDGPGRPWKRGKRGGGKIDWEKIRLTREMLNKLSIPWHEAPGEAEAECARLEQEGIVDAVWSDDSDTFMFGAKNLIRFHYLDKGNKKKQPKSTTHVRMWEASKIIEETGLDRENMIMWAMINGGDYDGTGLRNCGINTSKLAVQAGLGASLCAASSEADLAAWREELCQLFTRKRKDVTVPNEFPSASTLKKYATPKVSSREDLQQKHELFQSIWDGPINEAALRIFLYDKFNFWAKDYIKHVLPILLVKTLALTEEGKERANNFYRLEVVVAKRKSTIIGEQYLRKITFLPANVTTLPHFDKPPDDPTRQEDWAKKATKAGGPFDPLARVQCEILECILLRGIPHILAKAKDDAGAKAVATASGPAKKPRKKKQPVDIDEDIMEIPDPSTSSTSRKRKATSPEPSSHTSTTELAKSPKKQKTNAKEKVPKKSKTTKSNVDPSSSAPPDNPTPTPRKQFRPPPPMPRPLSQPTLPSTVNRISPARKAVVIGLPDSGDESEGLFVSEDTPARRKLVTDDSFHILSSREATPNPTPWRNNAPLPFRETPFSSPVHTAVSVAKLPKLPKFTKPLAPQISPVRAPALEVLKSPTPQTSSLQPPSSTTPYANAHLRNSPALTHVLAPSTSPARSNAFLAARSAWATRGFAMLDSRPKAVDTVETSSKKDSSILTPVKLSRSSFEDVIKSVESPKRTVPPPSSSDQFPRSQMPKSRSRPPKGPTSSGPKGPVGDVIDLTLD
ncbi:hypothetical protein EJ08DRAFT_603010 [Tothia fuscella]|uniref:XPG-I domain-containing protein n=1 Tax=Tothia fuscella TaxID=1048955 RepID=A0A9P4P282_9PEZI|nr:hypothetical protein EJ08DRAFT_603010 [Tothia fuscella]